MIILIMSNDNVYYLLVASIPPERIPRNWLFCRRACDTHVRGERIRLFWVNSFSVVAHVNDNTGNDPYTIFRKLKHMWSGWKLMVLGVPGHHRVLPRHSDTILFDISLSSKLVTWRMTFDAKCVGGHCRFVNRVCMLLGHAWNSFLAKHKIRKRETQSARVDGPRYNKLEGHPKRHIPKVRTPGF